MSWSGDGVPDGNWSNDANWNFAGHPTNGDTLIFAGGQTNFLNTNNIGGLTLNQIRFVGAGGGYTNRGSAFTVTNGIIATNTAGVNVIQNDITFATVGQIVDVRNAFTLSGILSGGVGMIKNGPGTLLLNGSQSNTHGKTTVNAGVVELAKIGGAKLAIPGDLLISSATVRYIGCCEIADTANITITNGGALDLNGQSDDVGTNIILHGTITTGVGSLFLSPNCNITVPPGGGGSISGNIDISSGTCTMQDETTLDISAVISGTANIVKTGAGNIRFGGANTYTGSFTANGSNYVWVTHARGLGATNGGTILNDKTWLALSGSITVTNEGLTVNSPWPEGALYVFAGDTDTWTGSVLLNTNITVLAFTNCGLVLSGGITGPGAITKIEAGTVTLSGSTSNSYAGTTTVNGGVLALNKTPFDGAIPHDLIISSTGMVQTLRGNQIANSASVTMGASTLLSLGGNLAINTVLPSPVHSNASTGDFTLGYAFTPNTNLTVTHVRHYFGTKVSIWTDAGTLLATQNVASVPGTWVETPLSTPLQLTAGSIYRVAAYTGGASSNYYWRTDLATNFPNGTIGNGYEVFGEAFPTGADGIHYWFVDFRYTTGSGGEGIASLNGSGSVNLGNNALTSFGTGAHTYDGVISGTGTFNVTGTNISYTLNGDNTYTGSTTLPDGAVHTIKINGFQPKSAVYVGDLALLGGSGTVGNITNKGTLSLGSSPGLLTSSNVIISPAPALYTVELTGPKAGVDYDQLDVRGTCSITNAGFSISFNFTKPVAVGQEFVIINNDGGEFIKGNFATWGGGATWTQNGYTAAISYFGGDGNDVSFTLANVPGAAAGSIVTAGNGDGVIAANECNNLSVAITNKTGTPMTGVTATLASQTAGVIVTESTVPYPNVPGNGKGTNAAPFQISTTTNFVCGTTINLLLSVTTSLGAFTVPVTIPTGVPSVSAVRFDNNTTLALSDISTNESTNFVSTWTGGPIAKVAVSLWMSAPQASDLNLTLIAPNGATVDLSSGNGAGANFGTGAADGSRTTFDDAAATSITAGAPPFVGLFKPEAPLSALIGTSPVVGNWRLRIADPFFIGTPDTLRNWSLFLYGTDCGTGSGVCELCPNVTFTSALGPNSPTQVGYLGVGSPSVCGVANVCPGTNTDTGVYPSENFTFRNGPGDACITVTLDDIGVHGMAIGAYLGSFNPANPDKCVNYLGSPGNYTGSVESLSFSFSVASNATFVVNVLGAGYGQYKLTVTGGDCRPALSATDVGAGKSKFDWTTSAAGYQLESTNALPGATVWPAITNAPVVINSRYTVTNTVPPANQFYHLRKSVP